MTTLEKNRLIGVAFLVVAFFHLATFSLTLFGVSLTYPYFTNTSNVVPGTIPGTTLSKSADETPTPVEPSGFPGFRMTPTPSTIPGAAAVPETKAQIDAKRTMTMIYVLLGIQFAVLIFILFAGFTVVNVRAGGRALGIVASIFLLLFYPLGTVVSILAIWFLTGDECMELYSDVEKDKRAPQSII